MRRVLEYTVVLILVCSIGTIRPPTHGTTYGPEAAKSLRSVPDTAPIAYLSARDRLEVGDTTGALRQTTRAVNQFPYHLPSFGLHYRLLTEVESTETARKWVKEQLQRTEYAVLLQELIDRRDRFSPTSRSLLVWGIENGYFTTTTATQLAESALAEGHYVRASEWLERALQQHPEQVELLTLKARLLARQGTCTRALDLVRELVREVPGRAEIHLLKARLLRTDNPESAQYSHDRYRSLLPEETSAQAIEDRQFPCS